jgi:hypothetical protein
MANYVSVVGPNGHRYQSATPKQPNSRGMTEAAGLLLRGVVVAVYVVDDGSHPATDYMPEGFDPPEMYCDVLCYGSSRARWVLKSRVLVAQPLGSGLHNGKIWRPRATTKNVSGTVAEGQTLQGVSAANDPGQWDGDHVLVGFIDNRPDMPVIVAAIPHPQVDKRDSAPNERRDMRLRVVDGDPSIWKHHGTLYGVETDGNFLVDTRFAHNGALDSVGHEPPPDTTGKGTQRYQLPRDAAFEVTLEEMADPAAPVPKVRLQLTRDAADIHFVDEDTRFFIDAAGQVLELGASPAGEWVPVDSKVQAELRRIRDELRALADDVAMHRHPQEMHWFPLIPNPVKPLIENVKSPLVYFPPSVGDPPFNAQTQAEAKAANAPMDAVPPGNVSEYVGPKIPPVPPRYSGLFTDAADPGATQSTRVKLDK